MKKTFKSVLAAIIAVTMIFAMVSCATVKKDANLSGGVYAGKTVILHDNDVHGAVEGYAKMAGLKSFYEDMGATVIVVSDGDFSQGTPYVSASKGLNAVKIMNAVGYDIVALGNHELDYGYENLAYIAGQGDFVTLCADVFKNGKPIFDSDVIVKVNGLSIGFFGLETPETSTKVNPGLIKELEFAFADGERKYDLYEITQKEIDKLSKKADVVICLGHLGIDEETVDKKCRSYDVMDNVTGNFFMIDGHSHTVMSEKRNGNGIQSTGMSFENIGVIVIDNVSKEIVDYFLVDTNYVKADAEVLAFIKEIEAEVDAEYKKVFAKSEVNLNGAKAPNGNRDSETNNGDIITDSMIWSVLKAGSLEVADDHVVAVTNGGGIRAAINEGDVTKAAVNTVLPFGNTIAVDYVSGAELLEALEASTYCTPDSVGGFPQVAGIEFTLNTKVAYDKGDLYPGSTYSAPKSIKRVTINSINGKPFKADDTYAVITNNFCAAGGDTYYAFKKAYDEGKGFDTGILLDEALMEYIEVVLNGTIDKRYAEPQGRITIIK